MPSPSATLLVMMGVVSRVSGWSLSRPAAAAARRGLGRAAAPSGRMCVGANRAPFCSMCAVATEEKPQKKKQQNQKGGKGGGGGGGQAAKGIAPRGVDFSAWYNEVIA